jgi:DNA primase
VPILSIGEEFVVVGVPILRARGPCLRNGRGQPQWRYSPRARAGFPIAAPVAWRQIVHGLRSDAFSIRLPSSRTARWNAHE